MTHTDINAILMERQGTHGDYTEHARITQSLKHVMHDTHNWSQLSAHQIETLEMIAHKIGRILAGDPHFADHFLDIAGYAKLTADRLSGHVSHPTPSRVLDSIMRGDHDINRVLAEIENEAVERR